MTAIELPFSPPCERNKQVILDFLKDVFARSSEVLEIGSGTGQHAVFFAEKLPHLVWHTSDLPANHPGLIARIAQEGPENVRLPLALDVAAPDWPLAQADGIFSANAVHIMSWPHVEKLFEGVGRVLAPGGRMALYGPFKYAGEFTTPSNADFDLWLKDRDPVSGVRDFEAVDKLARAQGLELLADHQMPANNQLLIWERRG